MAVGAPIPFRTAITRIVLSSIYLGMGNPLGIEAPILHVTAATASTFVSNGSRLFPDYCQLEHLPTWVFVGVTGGLSAAFSAPMAGITYALEEFMVKGEFPCVYPPLK